MGGAAEGSVSPSSRQRHIVSTLLLRLLDDPDTTLVVTAPILHEFIQVVTDARRFDPPVEMSEAVAIARRYLGRANVRCLDVGEDALLEALDLIGRHRPGRKRIADALLAAALLHHGASELITCSPSDFIVFEGLRVIDPRDERREDNERSRPRPGVPPRSP